MNTEDHAQFINEQYESGAATAKAATGKHERMARTIQSLLAAAEVAAKRGDEQARDEAIAKASALQLKYAIDDAMLAKAGVQERDELVHADFCAESNTPLIKAKRQLINGLAESHRGKALMVGEWRTAKTGKYAGRQKFNRRAKIRVFAHQSDLDFITMLYNSLIIQMQTMMAADEDLWIQGAMVPPHGWQAWRVSYAYGWVGRVLGRIAEAKRRNEAAAEAERAGTSLALRDRSQLVQKHVEELFGTLRTTRYRRDDHDLEGRRAGKEAAERADLGGKKITNDRKYLEA